MKSRVLLPVCSVLLVGTVTVRAGLRAVPAQYATQASMLADAVLLDGGGVSAARAVRLLALVSVGDRVGASSVAGERVERGRGEVAALPASPSSALLALSGLLSLGAVQLGRNVRKLRVSALPEWYEGGAVQVGHSTPLDLELGFTHAGLAVCVLARPIRGLGCIVVGGQWPDAAAWAPQFLPRFESPRAPPGNS